MAGTKLLMAFMIIWLIDTYINIIYPLLLFLILPSKCDQNEYNLTFSLLQTGETFLETNHWTTANLNSARTAFVFPNGTEVRKFTWFDTKSWKRASRSLFFQLAGVEVKQKSRKCVSWGPEKGYVPRSCGNKEKAFICKSSESNRFSLSKVTTA